MDCASSIIVFILMLQRKRERREIHKKHAKNGQRNYSQMLIKLFLLLGTAELIGFVQIPNSEQKEKFEVIFNVTFGIPYNFLRSSREIFMLALFVLNEIRLC